MNNYQQFDPYNSNFNYNNTTNGPGFGAGGFGSGMRTNGFTTDSTSADLITPLTNQNNHQHPYPSARNGSSSANSGGYHESERTGAGVKSSGILPTSILEKLDQLIDRLNASSGYSHTNTNNGDNTTSYSRNTDKNSSSSRNKSMNNNMPPPPVRIICIGTNEGIPLSRSYGTSPYSNTLSEEMLSSLETVWTTTPSSVSPQVMTSSIALQKQREQQQQDSNNNEKTSTVSYQPPHPLLHHIGMGSTVKSTTIYYENCIFIQLHFAPLVITIISSPYGTNVGYIKSFAFPVLKELLEPIRALVLEQRVQLSVAAMSLSSPSGGMGVGSSVSGQGVGDQNMLGISIDSNHVGNVSNGSQLDAYGNPRYL